MNESITEVDNYSRSREARNSITRGFLAFSMGFDPYGERETYYRNYGCFIENMGESIKDLEEAYSQYKRVFYISSKEDKTYYVIISNLKKN